MFRDVPHPPHTAVRRRPEGKLDAAKGGSAAKTDNKGNFGSRSSIGCLREDVERVPESFSFEILAAAVLISFIAGYTTRAIISAIRRKKIRAYREANRIFEK